MEDKIKKEILLDENIESEISKTLVLFIKMGLIYLISLIFSCLHSIVNLFHKSKGILSENDFIFNFRIVPIGYLTRIAFAIVALYYHFQAIKIQKEAFQFSDASLFGKSYNLYRKYFTYILISIIISILFELVYSYNNYLKSS